MGSNVDTFYSRAVLPGLICTQYTHVMYAHIYKHHTFSQLQNEYIHAQT